MSDEKKDSWEMPKPVFKSSEGSLPKSFEETISQSFIANAETLEIAEDDDILGIMDTLPGNVPVQAADLDEEPILETDFEPPAQEAVKSEDAPTPDAEETHPISVTAKDSTERSETATAGAQSSFTTYALFVLILAVAAVLFYYFSQRK